MFRKLRKCLEVDDNFNELLDEADDDSDNSSFEDLD